MGSEGIGLQEANDLFKRGWGNYPTGVSVITTGKEVIEGKGFVSNPDFTEYSISKIHGTFDFETSIE